LQAKPALPGTPAIMLLTPEMAPMNAAPKETTLENHVPCFGNAADECGTRSMAAMLLMAVLLGLGEKMGEWFLPVCLLAVAAFFSAARWSTGPAVNFLTTAGFGLIGTILFFGFGKDSAFKKAETITGTT
jgi:hypothetical protein